MGTPLSYARFYPRTGYCTRMLVRSTRTYMYCNTASGQPVTQRQHTVMSAGQRAALFNKQLVITFNANKNKGRAGALALATLTVYTCSYIARVSCATCCTALWLAPSPRGSCSWIAWYPTAQRGYGSYQVTLYCLPLFDLRSTAEVHVSLLLKYRSTASFVATVCAIKRLQYCREHPTHVQEHQ